MIEDDELLEQLLEQRLNERSRLAAIVVQALEAMRSIDTEIDLDGGGYAMDDVIFLRSITGHDDNEILHALLPDDLLSRDENSQPNNEEYE